MVKVEIGLERVIVQPTKVRARRLKAPSSSVIDEFDVCCGKQTNPVTGGPETGQTGAVLPASVAEMDIFGDD